MSSAQTLLGKPLGHIYTEVSIVMSELAWSYLFNRVVQDDWNDDAVAKVETNLAECDGQTRYQAGKVLAERAVLNFADRYGGSKALGWDIVSLVPVWVSLMLTP